MSYTFAGATEKNAAIRAADTAGVALAAELINVLPAAF